MAGEILGYSKFIIPAVNRNEAGIGDNGLNYWIVK